MIPLSQSLAVSFPSDCVLEACKTYIVDREIKLTSNLVLPNGITFIFKGGKFVSDVNVTIEAPVLADQEFYPFNGTSIIAPDCPIFGEKVSVTGYWISDYVAAVWFEPHKRNEEDANHRYDYADAINKAICMRGKGIVFLNRGKYRISKPIEIRTGITLRGEDSTEILPTWTVNVEKADESTKKINKYAHNRLLHINVTFVNRPIKLKDETGAEIDGPMMVFSESVDKTPITWVACENICFTNDPKVFPYGRCALVGNTCMFRNVRWTNFVQAVAFLSEYGDGKMLESCTASNDEFNDFSLEAFADFKNKDDLNFAKNIPDVNLMNFIDRFYENIKDDSGVNEHNTVDNSQLTISDLPDSEEGKKAKAFAESLRWSYFSMFNFGGLGDQLQFSHNHVNSLCQKLLFLNVSMGASVFSNILNGDFKVRRCKGVTIFSNHLEAGHELTGSQIQVEDSFVEIDSNYFEKGSRPSLYLEGSGRDRSIVTSTNNAICFMNVDKIKNVNGAFVPETIQEKVQRYRETCEYDIYMNEKVCLNLTDTYRMDLMSGSSVSMPYGVLIDTPAGPLREFNCHSYFASQNSAVLENYCVRASRNIRQLNSPFIYQFGINPDDDKKALWLGATGDYSYSYQIIWDRTRKIMKTDNGSDKFELAPPAPPSKIGTKTLQMVFNQTKVVALRLHCPTTGYQCMVRLERMGTIKSGDLQYLSYEYVEIPLSGADRIYDNGISVAGFKWKNCFEISRSSESIPFEAMSYNDGHVEAYAKEMPSDTSDWKECDIIYNVGSDNRWTQIIVK